MTTSICPIEIVDRLNYLSDLITICSIAHEYITDKSKPMIVLEYIAKEEIKRIENMIREL